MYPGTHAASTPDKPAIVMAATGATTTYRELDERSNHSGTPDYEMGEYVHAVIQTAADEAPADELRAFAREEVTHYKVPPVIDFRDELPRSPTGKLYKKPLRQEHFDERDLRS